MAEELTYLTGFGNEHASEALPGVLPAGQNSPQNVAYGLYAEQLSGSAFTTPRARNLRTWLYRIRPSIAHFSGRLAEAEPGLWRTAPCREARLPVTQLRWDPLPIAAGRYSWLEGLCTIATCGDASMQIGGAVHLYRATESMTNQVVVDADGELLIAPELGGLRLVTELGVLEVHPSEMAVIPRGVKFRVELAGGPARGYVCENYGLPLTLPEPGPIGLNALAMPRDFCYPTAAFDDRDQPHQLFVRYDGRLLVAELGHSPLDVVAWHGSYAPYKYDLRRYCPIGPVLFDHPDPSLWTVLTSPSDTPGVANIDFVLFRERWLVAEHTFRPPWFHSNVMSELMGLIEGAYDAKVEGFEPGGLSLHNSFIPHGPDSDAFSAASHGPLEPVRMEPFLAVMFESRYRWVPTGWALGLPERQADYADRWAALGSRFDPSSTPDPGGDPGR
jgi:homogentisate 1,2-dioxygenase